MTEANSTTPDKQPLTDPVIRRVAELEAANAELEAKNAELREQLATAGVAAAATGRTEPSFKFSAGQADELERTGRTVSPFTGKSYVGTSTADAREATAEEFAKAKPGVKAEPAKGAAAKPAARRK